MFMKYDESNRNKVGEGFRNPPILRGDTADANRSTSDNALKFADEQVYAPERNEFDYLMDKHLLTRLDIRYHEFVSNGPTLTDPAAKASILDKLESVLTVGEAREEAADVLGKQLDQIDEPWTKKPLALTIEEMKAGALAQQQTSGADPSADAAGGKGTKTKEPDQQPTTKRSLLEQAAAMASLRDAFASAEGGAAQERFKVFKSKDDAGRDIAVIQVPADVMEQWFTADNEAA